jgi:peptide/nickel transport system permease protein
MKPHYLAAISGMAGAAILVGACLLAGWIAPYGEAELVGGVWDAPTAAHWLGTDNIGRDMVARLLYGGRTTIGIALATTFLAFAVGVTAGFTAAIVGGWIDAALSRAIDVVLAVPLLIAALIVLSVLGTGDTVLVGTIAALEAARIYVVSRTTARSVAVLDFVMVARLRGEGLAWLICQEILPNALPPLLSEAGLRFCFIFLFIASLSFLGLGIQPPAADWGSMVRENVQAISLGLYAPLYPAAAIAILTIGVNLGIDRLLERRSRPDGQGLEL